MDVRTVISKNEATRTLTKEQVAFDNLFQGKGEDRINDSRLRMESFEVIQGRAAARIRIITKNNELITLKAPLLDFDVIGKARVFADASLKEVDMIDLATGQALKSTYQNMIQEAVLMSNTKGGGLQFSLAVGPKDNSDSAQIMIQAQRIQTAINSGQPLEQN